MQVKTDLRAGVTWNELWQGTQSALASGAHAVGTAAQGVAQQTQAVLDNPQVKETAGKLMWWPFGPPQF